jgi:hypothetical protein
VNRIGFPPLHTVIAFAKANSFAKVRFAVGFVKPAREFQTSLLNHHDVGPIGHQTITKEEYRRGREYPTSAEANSLRLVPYQHNDRIPG